MQLDPQQSLIVAIRQLDTFSVPGIGTFARKRVAAQIDHQTKRILPPQERFVLEPGEDQVQLLQDFLGRYYNLTAEKAQALSDEIGQWVANTLAQTGVVHFDGFGKLRKEEGSDAEFVPESSIFGQTNDFFGLQPVDYTVGESVKPSLEKKKAAAQSSSLAQQTIVEPARRKRRFPVGGILFLMVLVGLGTAAWYWQVPLKQKLQSSGLIPKDKPITDHNTASGGHDGMLSDSLEAIRRAVLEDSLANVQAFYEDSLQKADSIRIAMEGKNPVAKVEPKSIAKIEPKPVVKVEPKPIAKIEPKPIVKVEPKPIVKPTTGTAAAVPNDGKYGVRPENGHYYLVISSTQNGQEATDDAKAIAGAKVLAPYNNVGYYKVAVFESTNKSQVIQKMVEFKGRYTHSWIFWPGMPVKE